ncbi:MAG: hypothetical protein MJ093_03370 [Saccharofermentans sp.]|nr:hypothetical protein [Saccharofermentans sp.]
MRKHDFIETLAEKANITIDEATKVNEIIEAHSLIGKKSKLAATEEMGAALGVDFTRADEISNTAYDIIAQAMKEKIKHPFGSN